MLPTGETISPRSKFPDQTASINVSMPTSLGCLIGVHTRMAPDSQAFFDAHRDDGKRFVVRAHDQLTAFLKLESAICACGKLS
jgi:hypothetical protein